jgi:hypothetical protein
VSGEHSTAGPFKGPAVLAGGQTVTSW